MLSTDLQYCLGIHWRILKDRTTWLYCSYPGILSFKMPRVPMVTSVAQHLSRSLSALHDIASIVRASTKQDCSAQVIPAYASLWIVLSLVLLHSLDGCRYNISFIKYFTQYAHVRVQRVADH